MDAVPKSFSNSISNSCSMSISKRLAAAGLAAACCAVLAGCSPTELPHPNQDLFGDPVLVGASENGVTIPAVYLLIDQLGFMAADPEPDSTHPILVPSYEVEKDQRRALYQHPPSTYRFPGVPAGPGTRLLLAPVMDPQSFSTGSDGVTFDVTCRDEAGDDVALLSVHIAPAEHPEDRVWHDRELPLDACRAPSTEISLRTRCGPRRHCGSDWAAWGNPRVTYARKVDWKPTRLALLISIDTLRPDHLQPYGYGRETSPALARLAEDAVVFDTAVSTSPWTIPAHGSMLTSTFPRVHEASASEPISTSVQLVSEVLAGAGWQTAGFVDTPYLGAKHGFERGFADFDDDSPPSGNYRRGAEVGRERLLRWLAKADLRPAFVLWHIMDAHGPYGAPAPHAGRFRSEVAPVAGDPRLARLGKLAYHDYLHLERFDSFDDLVATYDEGIAFVDATIGRLLEVLRTAGVYDDALIIITSDHGESFLDHDVWVGHGLFLTDDEVRVPLIVKLPGNANAGLRVSSLVSLVDVAPTILSFTGNASPPAFQGQILPGLTQSESGAPHGPAFGFSSNTGASFVRTERAKLIRGQDPKKLAKHLRNAEGAPLPTNSFAERQLYDLERDPAEQSALTGELMEGRAQMLERLLDGHERRVAKRGTGVRRGQNTEVSSEERERLRKLGYLTD